MRSHDPERDLLKSRPADETVEEPLPFFAWVLVVLNVVASLAGGLALQSLFGLNIYVAGFIAMACCMAATAALLFFSVAAWVSVKVLWEHFLRKT
jgi:hypothetical protein